MKIVGGLVALLLLLVVIGFLLPNGLEMSRSLVIDAPPTAVYAKVADLRSWSEWDPWTAMDPGMEQTYEGPASGAGAIRRWKSDHPDVGAGSMTVTAAEPGRSLAFELRFEGYDEVATGSFDFAPQGSGTEVTWSFNGTFGPKPLGGFIVLLASGSLEEQFDSGLASLKGVVEGS